MKLKNSEVKNSYDAKGNFIGSTVTGTGVFRIQVEEYHRAYHDEMSWLEKTRSIATVQVFYYLCGLITFNSNYVSIAGKHSRVIMDRFGITRVTFYKSLRELMSVHAICRVLEYDAGKKRYVACRGEYFINPAMVWIGSDADRETAIDAFYNNIKNLNDDENDCGDDED